MSALPTFSLRCRFPGGFRHRSIPPRKPPLVIMMHVALVAGVVGNLYVGTMYVRNFRRSVWK